MDSSVYLFTWSTSRDDSRMHKTKEILEKVWWCLLIFQFNENTDRFRALIFHILFSTLPKSIKIKKWLPIREQCLKLIWTVVIRCLASASVPLADDEQTRFVINVAEIYSFSFPYSDHLSSSSVGYNIHLLVRHYFNVQCHRIPIQQIEFSINHVYKMLCRLYPLWLIIKSNIFNRMPIIHLLQKYWLKSALIFSFNISMISKQQFVCDVWPV